MRKTLIAVSALAGLALPSLAAAQAAAPAADAKPASPHTLTGNISLVSDYRFRGISQTFKQPALQGGFDYAHSSGFYAGNWNSNVNEGAGFPSGNLEMDFYGGWKQTWGDWGLDLGTIYYYYPGTDASARNGTTLVNPRNASNVHNGKISNWEAYIGGSWKWLSLKYYHAISDYFSQPGTNGSHYLDLSGTYDLGNGWNVVGHVGSFKLRNWDNGTDATKANYTDWKIGVTKDLSGWVLGAAYVDTTGKGSCNAANPGYYCFGNNAPFASSTKTKDASSGTVVFSVSKTF